MKLNRLEDLSQKCRGAATMEHPWKSDQVISRNIQKKKKERESGDG